MEKFVAAILAGVMDGAAFGLVALGIVLVYKAARILNFGLAEIGTVAIYLAWIQTTIGVPTVVAVLVALAVAAVMGAALERLLRPMAEAPRLTVTVATLGAATALGFVQFLIWGADPHQPPELVSGTPFAVAGIDFKAGRILALLITAGLGIGLFVFFKRTLFGLGVLAAAQDLTALRLMGLPFSRVSGFTWAAGGALVALAGIVLAPTIGSFHPFWITATLLIPALTAALVGGLTSLPGAFVGGIVVGVAQNFAKFYWTTLGGAEFVPVFALMILVLLVRPYGLLGAEA